MSADTIKNATAKTIYEEVVKWCNTYAEIAPGQFRPQGIGNADTLCDFIKYICESQPAEMTARELIKKLQERCWDHVCYGEGRLVNRNNPEDAWGEQKTANELLELAEDLEKEQQK